MSKSLDRILIVEDDLEDIDLIKEYIERARQFPATLETVATLSESLERLQHNDFDVVLLDLSLPDGQGLDTFRSLHARFPEIPILILSGLQDEEVAIAALQEGAQDYLVKGHFDRYLLIRAIRYAIERQHLLKTLRQQKELAQVTLKSIGDAVVTTDALGKIEYFNPIAERLTGWQIEEVKGIPLIEVFEIVNEITRQPVENPIAKVLKEGEIVGLTSHTLLISREGQEYAIDDSAAPIRDRDGQLLGAVMVFRDVTESRQLEQQLSWQAKHDALTGLANRRSFEELAIEAIASARESTLEHTLCYLDLDQFKVVNDTCGHIAGDELLRQIALLLKQQIRITDTLARLGGDEFGLLLYQCPLSRAKHIAESCRQLIQKFRFSWDGKSFSLGVSIGLVVIDAETKDLSSILSAADAACYAAKEKGRNCIHVYLLNDRELARQRGERQWIPKIKKTLEENRFCLYCQKIMSVKQGFGQDHYEILLRMIDETGEIVLPMAFIPAAERYALMPEIDRWVISNFFANYHNFCQIEGKNCANVYAINLSGASVNNPDFFSFLSEQFARYPIAPETICFEITETTAIANLNQAVQFIENLKTLGCRFALDDFGSGMSSLAYLKNLPVDYLKIDGSFVKNLISNPIDYAMVDCFNRLSHVMGIQTIAEFVDNKATLDELHNIGVDYAQGYGIEKPHPLGFRN